MNPAQLLAHFDRISEAPDAIPRLRRFILDLAVRGNLVEQHPNDEPESVVERSSPKPSRSHEVQESPGDGAWPYQVPNLWKWYRLDSISEQITDGEHATPARIYEQQVPLVTAKNVRDGFMDYGNTDWVSFETAKKAWVRCRPSVGDVLLVCVGATTGRLCVLREPRDMVLVRSVALIRPTSAIKVDYLAIVLNSPTCQAQIWGKVKMTAQPCLYINRIKSLPIPLPPLAEQHRIVAKMDELTALCDRLEAAQAERESRRDRVAAASLRRLNKPDDAPTLREHARFHLRHLPRLTTRPEHIQQLRQTILKLAVRGRLVPQDPTDEPASELLKRIQAEKERHAKKGHIKEQEPLLNVRLDEAWFAIPSSWCWVRLGMITQIVMGQSPPGATYNRTGEGIPLINGPVEFTEGPFGKTLINQYTTAPTNLCEEGDLLLCVRGSTTGRTNIAGFRACIGRGVAAIRPIFADHYVRLFIWRLRASIIGMGRGIAFPSVSRKQIEELPVPLPPLAEQHRIVAKVDELMAVCDRLEAQLTTAQAESRRLLEAVLHQALNQKS